MMDKADLEKWQTIEDEFLNSDLDEASFCKSRKLNLDWFRNKLCEAEQRSETNSENLFVELIPEIKPPTAACLKVCFREVDFELTDEFPVEVFRQALQVVKEVV
ncbi:MAG: hypothetical protein PHV82_18065 [Victivallaceae bacterium]|nr:hypothetical protein [Victivallaceae bacterium]